MKIMVAMSGGVDSSTAAALLKKQGHEVIGATMQLRPVSGCDDGAADSAVIDARKVADTLGVPHFVFDFRDVFSKTIINYFCREYCTGRTPNPCVVCNRHIKFGALWEKAREMGADFLATGHYAGVEKKHNRFLLKKGRDIKKDQSYFLYRLTQEQLSHTLFPLAALTKYKVKQMARILGLPTAARPESQEICFIPDNNYAKFVRESAATDAYPGAILDGSGRLLGQHRGIFNYTIGQRKGLGITAAEPLYVTAIDSLKNTVTVGTKEQTYVGELVAADLNWIAFSPPETTIKVKARIRYRSEEVEAVIIPAGDDELYVKLSTPQMAVTPGQSIVFYDGNTVIGGGTIMRQGR